MWPFKKKKDVTSPHVAGIKIEFATKWRPDKREVVIMTDKGPIILNEQSEFFVEIFGENVEPIKIQIIPDFANRELNFVETIDVNTKQTTDKNKGKIIFTGTKNSEPMLIGEYFKKFDEDIEKIGDQIHKYEIKRYILTIFSIIVISFNIYSFFINNTQYRYLNLLPIIILGYVIYVLWKINRDTRKEYDEMKKLREEIFGTIKEQ